MEFQPEKESWDSYRERLEHFFKATMMVDDEKKVFTLIHQNGPSLYTLLKELSFPNNPTLMSYDDVMDILKRHYVGAKSIFYERKVFYRAQMKPYDSASDWHLRLKALVINCNFGVFLEEILVDKFVTGFKGKVLQRFYEQDVTLSLQEALEIAQRYENDSTSIDNAKGGKDRARSGSRQRPQQQHAVQGHKQQKQQQVNQQQQKQQVNQKQQKPKQQQVESRQQQQPQQPQQWQRPQQQQVYQQQQLQQQQQPQPPQQWQRPNQQQVYQQQQQPRQQQQPQPQQWQQVYQQQQQPQQQQRQHQQRQPRQQQPPQDNREYRQPQQQVYQQGQPQQQATRNVPTCFNCGKQGHCANVCRSQIPKAEEGKSECCIS